ncbi:hypothetical protein [Halobaculum magnesiiphilum]|uniref:Uncharacterized protein n=1 Tax=Halobaculum magnesiiphilum TaxID=1017351 RepID=A0A8T8WI69_9EURY|nr:hypothetical protein [Halobaculum magnesiiphilum]QZP39540.1 hypothetical protein K6T50_18395 [Halobaculum magnesiiphilum]
MERVGELLVGRADIDTIDTPVIRGPVEVDAESFDERAQVGDTQITAGEDRVGESKERPDIYVVDESRATLIRNAGSFECGLDEGTEKARLVEDDADGLGSVRIELCDERVDDRRGGGEDVKLREGGRVACEGVDLLV